MEERTLSRRAKDVDAARALAGLRDGHTLVIGGSLFHNKPMHLVREIVRRKVRNLTVIGVPQASIDVDLLIAAGCVAEVRVPYLGFEYLGLASNYRRHASEGRVRVWSCDETQLLAGLEATSKNLPSGLVKTGVGTDLPRINPDLREVNDPITGEPMIAVAAIRPDYAILHATWGDVYGNLAYAGFAFGDLPIAEATNRGGGVVVAQVDEIVGNRRFNQDPFRTEVPHFMVNHVVEAPFGAYPCSSHGNYQYDEAHLADYVALSRESEARVHEYLDAHCHAVTTQAEYLDRHVKPSRLVALRQAIHERR